jgi:hypothetical protein
MTEQEKFEEMLDNSNNFKFIIDNFKANQTKDYKEWLESMSLWRHHYVLNDILRNWKPNIGIFPASFNPAHIGHLNILEKAEKIFDKVIIARGINHNNI